MENKNIFDGVPMSEADLAFADEYNRMLDVITSALESTHEFGLESEFVFEALSALKKNPDISIEDAVFAGLTEWDI